MTQTEVYVPVSELARIELLRQYSAYGADEVSIPEGTYELMGAVPEILSKYNFESYFIGVPENSDNIAFAAMDFVCENFGHDGCNGMEKNATLEGQIKFCEAHGGKTNCRGLSIMLAAILRLKGIKARHITCAPYENPFVDCHVVVDCLLPSEKRVMLDPTFRLYYTDENGEYVSLQALREILISGGDLYPNDKASYNGGAFDAQENREYMTKNTFRFFRGLNFADGVDEDFIDLIPKEYKQVRGRNYTVNSDAFWKM